MDNPQHIPRPQPSTGGGLIFGVIAIFVAIVLFGTMMSRVIIDEPGTVTPTATTAPSPSPTTTPADPPASTSAQPANPVDPQAPADPEAAKPAPPPTAPAPSPAP